MSRHTKPGLESASALISSSRFTKPAMTGSSSSARIRPMLTWAMLYCAIETSRRDAGVLRSSADQLIIKLLIQPFGEGGKFFIASEEVAHHLAARLRAALL